MSELESTSVDEVHLMSSMLTKSIVCKIEKEKSKKKLERLIFKINRFCWEKNKLLESKYYRTSSLLIFGNINKLKNRSRLNNLREILSLTCINKKQIRVLFSNSHYIDIYTRDISVKLLDNNEIWETNYRPNIGIKDFLEQ